MRRILFFAALGYLSGSLLFARFFGRIFCRRDITAGSPDQNPGTFNAFQNGGFLCGVLTLCGDLLKGFVPVFLYRGGSMPAAGMGLVFVMAAPVLGHILPVFHKFRGGKGIAVTFGCLLGLLPEARPLLIFAFVFLFFSLVVRITPNYHRTLFTYLVSVPGMILFVPDSAICLGFGLIAALVVGRLLRSSERKAACKVGLIWKY